MSILALQLPDGLEMRDYDLRFYLACKLYETGKLSTGQAAELVGISKREFIENMGDYGASLFVYTNNELLKELGNAKNYL